jgi:adenylate cyclase
MGYRDGMLLDWSRCDPSPSCRCRRRCEMPPSMSKAGFMSPVGAVRSSRARRSWRSAAAAMLLVTALSQTGSTAITDPSASMARPSRALIAVLPFTSREPHEEWELIASALGRHVIENLSRLPGTLVMSSESSDQWKASGQEPLGFARALGAQYVLLGGIDPVGDAIHVTAALFDTATGAQIWAQDFQESRSHLPLAAQTLARTANVALLDEAAKRSFYHHFSDPTSEDFTIRGLAVMNRGNTKDTITAARGHFQNALTLDPANVDAMTGLAHSYQRFASQSWSADPDADLVSGISLIDRALALDPNNAYGHFVRGILLSGARSIGAADREFETALAVNYSFAPAHAFGGYNRIFLGNAEATVAAVNQAIAISPRDPNLSIWFFFAGAAELMLQHDDAAIGWLEKSAAANPTYSTAYVWLTAAYQLTGRATDAARSRDEAKRLGRYFDLGRFRLQWSERSENPMFRRQIARVVDALKDAGVAE